MGFDLKYGGKGVWYGQFSHFPEELAGHGISTRFGGGSEGAFSSLNLALHNGDDRKTVVLNRRVYGGALGMPASAFVTAKQTHGTNILCVDPSYAGRGAFAYGDAIDDTDALITDVPGLPLLMFFADCVPVLIADPVKRVVAVSHAGWKGTVGKIAQKTVLAMKDRYGSSSADCLIGIGPSIGVCCYEVGEEVAEMFCEAFPTDSESLLQGGKDGKWKLDLWRANKIQLEEIGVPPSNIEVSAVCTACNSGLFFSYRADHGKTGRIAAAISLQK